MTKTTVFGYFLTWAVILGVLAILKNHWVFIISLLVVLGVATLLSSMRGGANQGSRSKDYPVSQRYAAHLRAIENGEASATLTKGLFESISTALAAGELSQKRIAHKFKVSPTTVSRIKNGKINPASLPE